MFRINKAPFADGALLMLIGVLGELRPRVL
jgi:hypothetical protein